MRLHLLLAKAFTPNNIMRGFKKVWLWPYKPNIFKEKDFLTSAVTDRPVPDALDSVETGNNLARIPIKSGPEQSSTPFSVTVMPEQVWPYHKAKPSVLSCRSRKKGSKKILTDTPVKRQIEEQEAKRKDKKHRVVRLEEKLGLLEELENQNKNRKQKKNYL